MILVLAGMGCFLLPLAWDADGGPAVRALKWLCVCACPVLYVAAVIGLCADPWRLALPLGARVAAATLAVPFLLLLVQSHVVEIAGSARAGPADRRPLVTTGTYALARHPGVLWYFFFHLLLAAAAGSVLLLLATPLWAGLNAAVAAVQDRLIFPRLFGSSYDQYRRAVPFFIPSRASLRRCLATLSLLRLGGDDR